MNLPKHLLVIRLSAMGDVAMTVPVISALVDQYPEVQITVLTKEFLTPIFAQLPNVNVYVADVRGKHKGIFGLWKLYKELKGLKIDAVAKKIFKPLKTTHERYADVFRTLNFTINLRDVSFLSKRPIAEIGQELLGSNEKITIGIAPFAAFEGKMYPLDLMTQVIAQLDKSDKYKILLFGGGKKEVDQLDTLEKQFSNTINLVGKFGFSQELDIISNLDVMVAMDSGNAHLAALFGISTITLWGVTHPHAGFYPFGQDKENALLADREKFPLIPTSIYGNKMPDGYSEAMRTIHPEDILRKIQTILEKEQD